MGPFASHSGDLTVLKDLPRGFLCVPGVLLSSAMFYYYLLACYAISTPGVISDPTYTYYMLACYALSTPGVVSEPT